MKKFIVGTKFSPSKTKDHSTLDVTSLLVSYGGGMGGANVTYYAQDIVKENESELEVECIDGRTMTLNKNFIVKREPVKVLKQIVDITAHANYHKTTCKEKLFVRFVKFYTNEEFSLSIRYY